jgi:hypothetical protein
MSSEGDIAMSRIIRSLALSVMLLAGPALAETVFNNGNGGGALPAAGDPFWNGAAPESIDVTFSETHNDWFNLNVPGFEAPKSGTTFNKTFNEIGVHRLNYEYEEVFVGSPLPTNPFTGWSGPMDFEPNVGSGLEVTESIVNSTGESWVGYRFQLKNAGIYVPCSGTICEDANQAIISSADLGALSVSDLGLTSSTDLGNVTIDLESLADGPIVTLMFENALVDGETLGLDYLVNLLGLPNNPGLNPGGFFLYQEPIPTVIPAPAGVALAMVGMGLVGCVRRRYA